MGSALLFIAVLLVVLAVVGLRRAVQRHETARVGEGHGARRFFQYLLLYGLLVVGATGLSGLVGRLFDRGQVLPDTESSLALYAAFSVVGIPLYGGLAWWTAKRLRADPAERRSRGWLLYVTAAALTALYSAVVGLHGLLSWAVGIAPYDGASLAALLVWGAVWFGHWWVDRRMAPDAFAAHQLLGSVAGLALTAVGAGSLLGSAIEMLLGTTGQQLYGSDENVLLPGAVLLLTGIPVWLVYWILPRRRYRRTALFFVQVLVVGVGGGLIAAVGAASLALFDLLVWLVGEPSSSVAATHFSRVPGAIAAVVVGAVVWWYHRAVLAEEGRSERTETRRVYEYLVAGIGLVAAAVGLMLMLVSILEALAGSSAVLVGTSSPINTVLAAATLLVVGAPVWWVFWRRIQAEATSDPVAERNSATRRIYVVVLFGVVGIAAVVALVSGVFIVLQDVFRGTVSAETLRSMRYPVGVIITAGLVSAYHWSVYRADRESGQALRRGPRFVLLVGAADPEIEHELSQRTRGRVKVWPRTDGEGAPWSVDELASLLMDRPDSEVVVLSEDGHLTVVPVDRS